MLMNAEYNDEKALYKKEHQSLDAFFQQIVWRVNVLI
jgi:hypothetical protein